MTRVARILLSAAFDVGVIDLFVIVWGGRPRPPLLLNLVFDFSDHFLNPVIPSAAFRFAPRIGMRSRGTRFFRPCQLILSIERH